MIKNDLVRLIWLIELNWYSDSYEIDMVKLVQLLAIMEQNPFRSCFPFLTKVPIAKLQQSRLAQFWKYFYKTTPLLVIIKLEIFWQDLWRKALVLVNPTLVEIF